MPRDDWRMAALADPYRGEYPEWPPSPMGDLAREDSYDPTDNPWARGVRQAEIIARRPPPEVSPRQGWGANLEEIGGRMGAGLRAVDPFAPTVKAWEGALPRGTAVPGMLSDEEQTLLNIHADQMRNWAIHTGYGLTFDPFRYGQRGAVTMGAGSKIVQPETQGPTKITVRPAQGGYPTEVAPGVTAEPASGMGAIAAPSAPAPWLDPTLARRIQRATKGGGSTTNINTGESPTSGLMMGIYENADPRAFNTPGQLKQADLENFVKTNRTALRLPGRSDLVGPRQPGDRYLGTWRDPDTGVTYVDVSQRFDPGEIRPATKFGERTGQLAGYNLGTKESFPVGNWPAYIQEPGFQQRMHEMAAAGQQYLSQHPTREWWTNEPFARVYGPEMMPNVAGYTAATAPNSAPRENLQTMSEYARRHIRGEPVIQPEWRVPEGMMTRSPGVQIGMEQSRAANLDRAFRGATSELQRQKVREEAYALLGDEGAVVLDRHWARLAEDPSRGVFANAQEGVISSAPRKGPTDYDLLKAEVVRAAQTAGRTPRDFSADVWTGIRDTIQKTSELYGQKFRGSAITGESKSYADHFEDLIRDKAQHLGITIGEMEKRLRSGDANLMSWVLATTPVAWQAYRQYQGRTDSSSNDKNLPSADGPQTARDGL